ncbi:helix-turn-helix domain-containing protein [Streptomyces aidingensis]|nr:helix-turn-helix domain-containing protein [Streptomyces aidingensis]
MAKGNVSHQAWSAGQLYWRGSMPVSSITQSQSSVPYSNRARGGRQSEPILMDTAELAIMLNMSVSWVYREAAKLGLKGYKLGRGRNAKVLYKRAEVLKWLEQQKIH